MLYLLKGGYRFIAICQCQLLIFMQQRQEWYFHPLPSYRLIIAAVFLHGRREWESNQLVGKMLGAMH